MSAPTDIEAFCERLETEHNCTGCGEYAGSPIADTMHLAATTLRATAAERDEAHELKEHARKCCDKAEADRDRLSARVGDLEKRLAEAKRENAAWADAFNSGTLQEAKAIIERLVNAKALAGVRELVAGWNGENLPDDKRYDRHHSRLGATLPKTTCGAVYDLDEALSDAHDFLATQKDKTDG